jgi:hypothetical protein
MADAMASAMPISASRGMPEVTFAHGNCNPRNAHPEGILLQIATRLMDPLMMILTALLLHLRPSRETGFSHIWRVFPPEYACISKKWFLSHLI